MTGWVIRAVMTATLMLSPSAMAAQSPTFDCAKAQGEVESLVCKDAGLAALDRKLDEVFKAATAKAQGRELATLRAEQRGWVKGRNECWKAQNAANPVFLTASWKAESVRECVEGQYKIRTSELQALWQLVAPRKPVFYACENNPANEVVATFFDTDPPTARLERGDRSVTVWEVRAASGAKCEGQNVTFWTKGNEATVTWMHPATGVTEDLKCRMR